MITDNLMETVKLVKAQAHLIIFRLGLRQSVGRALCAYHARRAGQRPQGARRERPRHSGSDAAAHSSVSSARQRESVSLSVSLSLLHFPQLLKTEFWSLVMF